MAYHQLILSLGGNMGNKAEIFAETSDLIEKHIGNIILLSSAYETPPWGFESKNHFRNQVLIVKTNLLPEDVLAQIGLIENHFGRIRKPGVYLSRMMDIDILFYDDKVIDTSELTIPHPQIEHRRFILEPLNDILPGFVHPLNGKTVAEMLADCQDNSVLKRIDMNY